MSRYLSFAVSVMLLASCAFTFGLSMAWGLEDCDQANCYDAVKCHIALDGDNESDCRIFHADNGCINFYWMLANFGKDGACESTSGTTGLYSCTYSHCAQYCKTGGVHPQMMSCDFSATACTKLYDVPKKTCKKSGSG